MAEELFPSVLPPEQVQVLRTLSEPVTSRGFYLGGGTALALQLGHRRSVDFDWFREESIPDPLQLASELRAIIPHLEVEGTAPDTLHGLIDGVRLSWFTYSYPSLQPPIHLPNFGCNLASVRDIAAMKLAAVSQRGERKDFFDLVAIGRSGLSLDAMLAAYRQKFAIVDMGHVLTALTWFEDADADPTPILDSADSWEAVKSTVLSWVKSL